MLCVFVCTCVRVRACRCVCTIARGWARAYVYDCVRTWSYLFVLVFAVDVEMLTFHCFSELYVQK